MQITFFVESNREEKLTKMGDVLQQINLVVNWEIFRPILEPVHIKT